MHAARGYDHLVGVYSVLVGDHLAQVEPSRRWRIVKGELCQRIVGAVEQIADPQRRRHALREVVLHVLDGERHDVEWRERAHRVAFHHRVGGFQWWAWCAMGDGAAEAGAVSRAARFGVT